MYNCFLSPNAYEKLLGYASYIANKLHNEVAAMALLDDADETLNELSTVAGSMRLCDHPILARKGYRKIFFLRHDYVMIYRVNGENAEVLGIYHTLQDYENHFYKEQ